MGCRRTILTLVVMLTSGAATAHGHEPFFLGLGGLPGGTVFSDAWGISADGTTVVGRGNAESGFVAFRWNSTTGMIPLGTLPGGDLRSIAPEQ